MIKKETVNNNSAAHLVYPIAAQDLNFDASAFKKSSLISFSTYKRVLEQNWRQGTVSCQGRADVSRTNKKPWKQKGTGRARAGTARSPLWKGGGVIFGPQPRVRTLKMSKQARQKVMLSLLAQYLEQKNIVCADWSLVSKDPKTSEAKALLKDLGLENRKIALFVAPYDFHLALSFANIPNVHPLSFDQANAYDLANSDCWLFLKKDLDHFKGMVSQWL
jgi:large subunit ribosomal protein L4